MNSAALKPAVRDDLVDANDEPGNHAVYQEYLRGFDDVPVLQDAVRSPPARSPEPDFRLGERRDVRQAPRPDAYSVREANAAELELLYQEYSQPTPAAVSSRPKKKRKRKSKSKKA